MEEYEYRSTIDRRIVGRGRSENGYMIRCEDIGLILTPNS